MWYEEKREKQLGDRSPNAEKEKSVGAWARSRVTEKGDRGECGIYWGDVSQFLLGGHLGEQPTNHK